MRHIDDIFGHIGGVQSFNLHNHTVYSDGTHTPAELLTEAKSKLITVISITDHDSIGAYIKGEALKHSKEIGIIMVPGFEATVKDHDINGYTSHMLMYFNQRLLGDKAFLKDFKDTVGQARTKKTLSQRLAKLNEVFGLDLALSDFESQIIDIDFSNINSYIIKNVIKLKYPHLTKSQVDFMLSDDSPGNFKIGTSINDLSYLRFKYDIASVLAHPMLNRDESNHEMNSATLAYIEKLTKSGVIDGLELYHPDVNDISREILSDLKHVLQTAGSDTHNKNGSRLLKNTGVSQIINHSNIPMKKSNVAVMVGRLNPPHIGHIRVIDKALSESETLVMFLGSANVINEKNPFSFMQRKAFLEKMFSNEIKSGKLIVSYLDDVGNDREWTSNLGSKVKDLVSDFDGNINFYGGDFAEDRAITAIRDNESELNAKNVFYTQVHREHFTLPSGEDISATNLRNALNSGDEDTARKFLLPEIADDVIIAWKNR